MAAVRSPLMPSPSSGLGSSFSPYTDSPSSPAGPFSHKPDRSSTDSKGHLHPQPPKSPQAGSPNDAVAPSPIVSSNGTDIDETAEAPAEEPAAAEPQSAVSDGATSQKENIKVATKDADGNDFRPSSAEDDHPSSVIHAPKGFEPFAEVKSSSTIGRVTPTPSTRSDTTMRSDVTVISPNEEEAGKSSAPLSPPPISTAIPPMHEALTTPRAQTRQEAELIEKERADRVKSNILEDIPEKDTDTDDDQSSRTEKAEQSRKRANEVAALRTALTECWTLCNTLAGLSHMHRKRAFQRSRQQDGREQAWESCWTLCQKLYVTWDEEVPTPVQDTLILCRQFCQSLFAVRQKDNDLADSVLRVSFELNNHLYNTHDRTLPETFSERTLDFYITLCHRLMKQRNKMAEETDDLLRACWSLAEMLFSLRQNKREGKQHDEEMLGSAVQSCWDLCDLFREGWTQIRPERGTPRPSHSNFDQKYRQAGDDDALTVTLDDTDYEDDDFGRANPETPTTVFEDTQQMSPEEQTVPNIVVLGPDTFETRFADWSSSSGSSRSGYGSSEEKSSSSVTAQQPQLQSREDARLTCLRVLIIRAAVSFGFQRNSTESFGGFVKSMPTNAFGAQTWQMQLLSEYKRLIATDPAFRVLGPPRRASATDIARSVSWMVASGQCPWLRDLYRSVFGFRVEEAGSRPGLGIEG